MIDSITKLRDTLEDSLLQPAENSNMEKSERVLSLMAGAFMFCKGVGNLYSYPMIAFGEAIIGTYLLQRGVTGRCMIKEMSEEQNESKDTILFAEISQPQSVPNETGL